MKNRLYERIGYAYVLRQLLTRAIMVDEGDIWHRDKASCKAYGHVNTYLEGLVKEAIDFGIERGDFALADFQLDALAEEFARAVYRITRIEAQKPPTFRDVLRAKFAAWKVRALTH